MPTPIHSLSPRPATPALLMLFLIIAASASAVRAEDESIAAIGRRLDETIPALLREDGVPGAVIAIGRRTDDGYDSAVRTYGLIRVEPDKIAMPTNAIFDMASLTKPIAAATSIMILVDRDKVKLDDPVARFLPEFDNDSQRSVTVRHLLTHTSGMPAYLSMNTRNALKAEHGFPCPDPIRATIRATNPATPAGERMTYSCLNAVLVAQIVEKVSGEPLDVFARENIFAPLGMSDTGFRPSEALIERTAPTTRAEYGRGPGGFLTGQVHDPIAAMQDGVSGNAGLFSTAADLSRFARMMLDGGLLEGRRILGRETVEAMTRVQNPGVKDARGKENRRGLGWDIYEVDDGLRAGCYGHTGYTGTAMRLYPERGVYAIVLTNRVHPDDTGRVDRIRQTVWDLADGLPSQPRKP